MLSILVFLPLIPALLILLLPEDKRNYLWGTGVFFSLLHLFLFILLPVKKTSLFKINILESFSWIPQIGVQYSLFIDGLSYVLGILTLLLSLVSLIFSIQEIKNRVKEFLFWNFLLVTGILGVFLSRDLFLFFIFWEVMLIPMFFIIGIWGYANRRYAAFKFILYTMAGSAFFLTGIIILGIYVKTTTGIFFFDLDRLKDIIYPTKIETLLFFFFSISFAIKVPIFPLHTWLPDAHTEAPTAGSIILAGVLLKIGVYGFLRIVFPLFERALSTFSPLFIVLGVTGIIYGALMAWAQKDLKRLIAYSSVSHMGFVILGIFTLLGEGLSGGKLQLVNHGITTSALFMIAGSIYKRTHTRIISKMGGMAQPLPILSFLFAFFILSSIGLPGLNNFVGEFLIIFSAYKTRFLLSIFAVTGVILSAVYFLSAYRRTMFGPEKTLSIQDLSWIEIIAFSPLFLLVIYLGLNPNIFFEIVK